MPEPAVAARSLMATLQVAVDAHELLRDRRGIGTYVRALLSRFAQRDDLRLTLLLHEFWPQRLARAIAADIGVAPGRLRCARRIPADADVVWHPWNGTFFRSSRPSVATIHDVIPFALPAADAARRASQQAPIRETAASTGAIICDSRFTAADIGRYLDVAAERLHPIPLGVDRAFSPGALDALPDSVRERPYVLYVGAHDAHKNVLTLAAAHERAFPDGDVALVFTRPNPLVPRAIVCDGVALPALIALYRGAAIVAVPSLYEGFGLPVLEAMACGAPVLAARATALPEAGGDAALYVDEPREAGAWQRALVELMGNAPLRAHHALAGPPHAAGFTWERCAERTFAVLRATAATST